MNGQRLETVTSFKYLSSVITDEGSKPEILYMIAQTTAALAWLKPVWNDRIFLPHGPSQQSFKEEYKSWK